VLVRGRMDEPDRIEERFEEILREIVEKGAR
jgi:hypothetical protein